MATVCSTEQRAPQKTLVGPLGTRLSDRGAQNLVLDLDLALALVLARFDSE